MFNRLQNAGLVLVALAVCQWPAAAQVTVGQNMELTSGGDLSFGYSGSNGNQEASSHSLDMGGHGWLRGFYYKPQFLSFEFQPYYRRAKNNSIYQTITNGSGFSASSSLFSGSRFPGSVSYSKTYDSSGQFGVPGITGITSHGNGDNFNVNWSMLLPNLPTLTATYSTTSGDATVFGTNTESSSNSVNFTLQSTYRLAGFDLMGQYYRFSIDTTFPSFFEIEETSESRTKSHATLFTASHRLPLTGHWNLVWNRSHYEGAYRNGDAVGVNSGVVNDLNSMVTLNPTAKLGVMMGATYNDNAFGALQQRFQESGGVLNPSLSTALRTLSVNSQASYTLFTRLTLYGRVNHFEQWTRGLQRGLTQFSGNATYSYARPFLGAFTFSVGVVDTMTEQGNTGASLVGNVNYLRRRGTWEWGADFGYSQQIQTLYTVYATSTYRYGGNLKKRFHGLQWIGGFNGSHSGMTQQEGYSTRTESFTTSLLISRFTVHGNYTQSSGTSILTSGGLVELPPGVPPSLLLLPVLYDARSYGGGASVRPFRRGVFSVSYNKAHSATTATTATTRNSGFDSTIFNSRFQYRLRKMDLEANFTRFEQSIVSGSLPAVINSYYIRFSRWFNIF